MTPRPKPEEEKLFEVIRSAREEIIADLAALVRIPSVVGEEGAVQQHMKRRLARLGMQVDEFEADAEAISRHRAFVPLPPNYRGRPNIVGNLSGPEERSLILNGHIDVVSPEPVDQWRHDPWGAEIENGKLYGRGAADMKGGVVAALWAVEAIRRAGFRPASRLLFESVIEEEAGGSGGTLACFLRGYRAKAMLVPEPQSRIAIAHAGVLYFRVRTHGRAAHAGLAHEGLNAIGKLNLLYDALVELDRERGTTVHYEPFEQGSGRSCHICVGTYRAGDWPSKVAARAELEARISFIPGETREDIHKLVEARVRRAAEQDPWLREHPPEIEWFGWRADPWEQPAGHPFIGTLRDAVETIQGAPAELVGKAAAMDTRFSSYFETAAASFGPDGGNYHGADEFVEIESVIQCAQVIALAIARWCGLEA
jgi:acetylornithine deacetylase